MVAHVWAQQSQATGRGSNFYFEGPTIYSYGRHFPIAKVVINAKGESAVLFTNRKYSISTSRHISYARNALLSTQKILWVPNPEGSARDVQESYAADRDDAVKSAALSPVRFRQKWLDRAQQAVDHANDYAQFYALEWRLAMPALSPEYIAEAQAVNKALKATKKARHAEVKARYEERARVNAMEGAERVAMWLRSEDVYLHNGDVPPDMGTLLRVKGNTVETSRGAKAPLSDVRRVADLYARVVAANSLPWEPGDYAHDDRKLGHFRLDAIDAEGNVTAGCHTIRRATVEALLASLEITMLRRADK
jgi:hypothetical protein